MRRRKDSDDLDYDDHNLWILDERLNFTSYVSSDKPIGKSKGDRTDITVYNRRVAFRGENEASNPITIFEFKKPQRDNFADPSRSEEHTSELQSLMRISYAVFCLKKKKSNKYTIHNIHTH